MSLMYSIQILQPNLIILCIKTRDLNGIQRIKDEDQRILVNVEQIKERWKNYFDNLFNGNGMKDRVIWVVQQRIEIVDLFKELG